MIIPSKFSGYQADRRIYPGGGDSAPAAPTQQTVTQTNIPEYARPYVEDVLGRSHALSTQNGYQSYGGPRVAGQTGLQHNAANIAGQMRPSTELNQVASNASGIMARAQGAGMYTPGNFNNTNALMASTGQWNPMSARQYMNPYMQAVTDIQKREAVRQSNIMGQNDGAQAVGAGAFGGSRHAIVDAERERNLGQQLNDIQAQGSNRAWDQAQQMFTSDQGRSLAAQQGNQQTWESFGNRNLNMQQMREQSRQFGAQQGLAGLNAQLQANSQLADVGQSRYNQQVGIVGLQNQLGTQQQAMQQAGLDASYQDWVNRQMHPYRQLEFMNNQLRGNYSPNTTSSMYQAPPSAVTQAAGLGTAALGMSRLMAKGGLVTDVEAKPVKKSKKYAKGGAVDTGGIAELLISQIK